MTTQDDALRSMIEFLTESHRNDYEGGGTYDWTWIGSTLCFAALDHDGGTAIIKYTRSELLKWYGRAKRFQKCQEKKGDLSFVDRFDYCLWETEEREQ